ncbi:hypothetical protein CYMTET_52805 [Cymbomonas tetramitiformis]|uniref:Uncharacterized protein n=1 Tax=Cymbomonas tetramitiformis TaxID=36881 RepID=A0AAE0EQP7_9CHLO|nr:hypothetical protein CYMTET_52805 [Cymbomonas tetramitiformis]
MIEPLPSWAQVANDTTFGVDTSMGQDSGTLSGEKRSHPTAETLDTTSPSKRTQVNVKQAKGTSASSAVRYSLYGQKVMGIGFGSSQRPKGAAPERHRRPADAQVSASAAPGGLAICGTSGVELSSMDDEENYEK